jgi:hypothetical protein
MEIRETIVERGEFRATKPPAVESERIRTPPPPPPPPMVRPIQK